MKKFFLGGIALFLFLLAGCKNEPSQTESPQEKLPTGSTELLAMVMMDGKYGYIDTLGGFKIEPKYPLARSFSNGLACVNVDGVRTDLINGAVGGEYIFIDATGAVQFDGKTFSQPTSFYEGFAPVRMPDDKVGFINTSGTLIAEDFDAMMPFSEGLAAALDMENESIGYIDSSGTWKIKLHVDYTLGDFHQGRTFFMKDEKYGFLDTNGQEVVPATYEGTYDYNDGLAAFLQDDLFGFLDLDGTVAIPNTYEDVADFSEGLCAVQKDGKWGYINKHNELVIPFQYTAVRSFNEGIAAVQLDGKVGFITADGNWLVEPKYGNALDFKNGFAIVQSDLKLGYINRKGVEVISPRFERADNFVNPQDSNPILKVN
ncbi:WG repeat-containing protein [Gilvibacter sp.]|uniref:WG repeat-containing protein n=1 Tax=Gilvibacter sp. TaxID=2729997 RepID=UPI003F49F38B